MLVTRGLSPPGSPRSRKREDEDESYEQEMALPYPLPSLPPAPCSNVQKEAPRRKSDLGRIFRNERKSKQYRQSDPSISILDAMGVPSSRSRKVRTPAGMRSNAVAIPEECSGNPSSKSPSVELSLAEQGVANVEECLSWMRPRKMDCGFLSTIARLGVEVDARSQQWCAAGPQDIVGSLPLEPYDTSQATSLLLRIVRSLPSRLPLRSMLEPLVQVILRSVYREWPWVPTLADFEEDDVMAETIMNFIPFYSLVFGHQGRADTSRAEADAAIAEAEQLRATTEDAVRKAAEEHKKSASVKEELEVVSKAREIAEKSVLELKDDSKRLQRDLKKVLSDFADMQNRLEGGRQDLRDMQKESKGKDGIITDLRGQVQKLTSVNSRLEEENGKMRALLRDQKADIDLMPKMREELQSYQSAEALHGVRFAARVAKEILEIGLEDICGVGEAELTRRGDQSGVSQQKVVLDAVCSKLHELPRTIEHLKKKILSQQEQVKQIKQLVPIWNEDAKEDLEDAYNQDAPVHRQIFSMKDRRCFAGLGIGEDVPPYLRAEGMVRHLFVSKAELEDFMSDFTDYFFSPDRQHEISTESMHNELYQHMKLRFQDKKEENQEALFEFAYAFICSLEAYRNDPDFELFDLMLSGAVHPSITKDQREMLQCIEAIIRQCAESQVGEEGHKRNTKHHRVESKEQVSRRVIRAALEVTFPDKTASRHDSLRRALYVTIQMLSDASKTPSPDYVFTGDLFAASADGSQTPLVEEIRRQHVYEIIEFTCQLSRKLLNGRSLKDKTTNTHEKGLATLIQSLDPHCAHTHAVELSRIGCPDPGSNFPVRDVLRRLRHSALLRPKRLWVRSEPKDVVKRLTSLAVAYGHSDSEMDNKPKRIKALKVLTNPYDSQQTDSFNDPDNLEKVAQSLHGSRHRAESKGSIVVT